ncbi:hypothetical protein Tco_1211954 [Tanacetum coccineum]
MLVSSSTHPVPSTSLPTPTPPPIPIPTPPPIPTPTPPPIPIPIPETEPAPFEHTYEEPSPVHQHFSPPQEQAQGQLTMDDLLQVVPQLISRIDSLETDLKQTKLTMGNALVKLVKKVKKLEGFLKRRNMVLSDSEEEEPEAQGRKSQDDPLDSLVQGLVTPSTTKVNASGEEQVEDISPNTLEAAKTLSRVASLEPKSIDKGRRYKRRKEAKGKKVVSSLDFQEEVDTGAEQVNTAKGFNTGSIKLSTVSEQLSTGNEQVSTVGAKKSTSSHDKGQREGKAPMISEETPKKSKEQILQEEASLAEAIRLDSLQKEEEAKQIHLDSLLAQRIAEEEELNEQQKKRKAQVQFEAQHYTNEDWDLIRAKIEANAELSKSMLGSELQGEDFAKKMVDLVNQRKKYFAEERARAKRNKPMTQSQLKTYMMNYLKNQGTWKLSQLKNLSFEEVKEEFDKLVKQVESFAPINFEATKASLKRFGEELQTKTSKRLKSDEEKDDKPTKKSGKRRKKMARKGLHTNIDKDDSEDSDEVSEQDDSVSGTKISIKPISSVAEKLENEMLQRSNRDDTSVPISKTCCKEQGAGSNSRKSNVVVPNILKDKVYNNFQKFKDEGEPLSNIFTWSITVFKHCIIKRDFYGTFIHTLLVALLRYSHVIGFGIIRGYIYVYIIAWRPARSADTPECCTASSDYVPGPEEPEQAPLSLDYVPGLEYPKYLAPSDVEVPIEDQPYVIADSPIALSPSYVADSDPEENL